MSMPSAASPAASRVRHAMSIRWHGGRVAVLAALRRSSSAGAAGSAARPGLGEGAQRGRGRGQDVGQRGGHLGPLAADDRRGLADRAPAAVARRAVALGRGRRRGRCAASRAAGGPARSSRYRGSWVPSLSGEEVGGPELWIGPEADHETRRRPCRGRRSRPPVTSQRRSSASSRIDRRASADADHEVVDPAGQAGAAPRSANGQRHGQLPGVLGAARRAGASGTAAVRGQLEAVEQRRPASSTSPGATACSGTRCTGRDPGEGGQDVVLLGGPPRRTTPPRPSSGSTRVRTRPGGQPVQRQRGDRRAQGRRRRPPRLGDQARRVGRIGEPVAGQQPLDDGHGRERGVDRPALGGAGGDGGRADGAERPHAGRHAAGRATSAAPRAAPTSAGHRLAAVRRPGRRGRPRRGRARRTAPGRRCPAAGPPSSRGGRVSCGTTAPTRAGRAAPQPLDGGLRVDADDGQARPRRPAPAPGTACRDSSTVRRPDRAARTAAAAARVEVPAPPGPVRRSVRTRPLVDNSALDALLELLESRVEDDLLGLALDHAEHRDREVDGDRVGDLGAAVGLVEGVRARPAASASGP